MEKKIKIGLIIGLLIICVLFTCGCINNDKKISTISKKGIFLEGQIDKLNNSQTLVFFIFTIEEPTSEELGQIKIYGKLLSEPTVFKKGQDKVWLTPLKTKVANIQDIEKLYFVYKIEIQPVIKEPWMNKVESLVADFAMIRPLNGTLIVYIYCKDKPTSNQVSQIENLEGSTDIEHWIPPVGSHPNGFFPATIKVKSLPDIAKMEWVSQILSAERVHTTSHTPSVENIRPTPE